ncbi:hypothetical protein XAC2852_130009 [Xanthomonas citri pv. citri]|nr:hypothetical protein XAC2852_130009 [Xanthomonas citri pv. citri]
MAHFAQAPRPLPGLPPGRATRAAASLLPHPRHASPMIESLQGSPALERNSGACHITNVRQARAPRYAQHVQWKRSLRIAAGRRAADGGGLRRVQTVQTVQGAQQRGFAGTEYGTELLFHAQYFGLGGGQERGTGRGERKVLHAPVLPTTHLPQQATLDQPGHHDRQIRRRHVQHIADLALVDARVAIHQHQQREVDRLEVERGHALLEHPPHHQFGAGDAIPQQPQQPRLIHRGDGIGQGRSKGGDGHGGSRDEGSGRTGTRKAPHPQRRSTACIAL